VARNDGRQSGAQPAIIIGTAGGRAEAVLAPDQNIENNPMHSSLQRNLAGAGMRDIARRHFDSSGESPTTFDHRATLAFTT